VVAGIEGSRTVELGEAAWQPLRARLADTKLGSETGTVVCDRMRLARNGTGTQHAVAPAMLPAADAAWVRDLAAALDRAGAADLAAALTDRLRQFAAP
jgi:truncated hemoglobin YjbI